MKILLLDDQPDLIKGYANALARERYSVHVVSNSEEAKDFILRHRPTIVVLDVSLLHPDVIANRKRESEDRGQRTYMEEEGDGFHMAAWIKIHAPSTGIVMLTSERTDVDDRIRGLDVGADDYIQKGTILYSEFCARIRALVRRLAPQERDIFMIGELEFDFKAATIKSDAGDSVKLTAAETKLLEAFCLRRGERLSRSDLYRSTFGKPQQSPSDRAIDNLVSRIKGKVESGLGATLPISSEYGTGYQLRA